MEEQDHNFNFGRAGSQFEFGRAGSKLEFWKTRVTILITIFRFLTTFVDGV